MPSLRSVCLAALSSALLLACDPSLKIPPGAQIECASDDACPSTMRCGPRGRCVSLDRDDTRPPAVSEVVLEGSPATVGAVARVRFRVDEPLASVEVRGLSASRSATLAWSCDASGAPEQPVRCERTVGEADEEGPEELQATLFDRSENDFTGPLGARLVVDRSPPGLEASLARALVAGGGQVVVTVTSTEPLAGGAPELVASPELAFEPPAVSGQAWTFRAPVPPAEAGSCVEGAVHRLSVLARDPAGNEASREIEGGVLLDTCPPLAVGALVTVSDPDAPSIERPRARAGAVVRAEFEVSEETETPTLWLAAQSAPCLLEAGRARCELVVDPARVPSGGHALLAGLRDLAGNEAQPVLETLLVDHEPPGIASFVAAPSPAPLGARVRIVLTPDDALASEPLLQGPAGFALDGPQRSGNSWTWTHLVVEGDPPQAAFTVELEDEAGNRAVAPAPQPLLLDALAPRLAGDPAVCVVRPDGERRCAPEELFAAAGALVEVEAELAGGPAWVDGALGTLSLSPDPLFPQPDGALRLTGSIPGNAAEGAFPLTVELRDEAGNQTVQTVGLVTVDRTLPGLRDAQLSPAGANGASVVVVSVSPSEPLGAPPALVALAKPGQLPGPGPATPGFALDPGSFYTFSYDAAADVAAGVGQADGVWLLEVSLEDRAGNRSPAERLARAGADLELVIDASAPRLLSLAVAPARLGPSGTLAATFAVESTDPDGPPDVEASVLWDESGGSLSPMACLEGATAGEWSCTATPPAGLPPVLRSVPVTVEASDRAGNRAREVRFVLLDLIAPGVASAGASYESPATVVVSPALAGALDTRVTVTLVADEELDEAGCGADPALCPSARVVVDATRSLALTLQQHSSGSAVFLSEPIDAGLAGLDGLFDLALSWRDPVGNATSELVVPGLVRLQTVRPTLLVDQDRLLFLKSPTGNELEEDLGGWRIPAGPLYALWPAEAADPAAALDASVLRLASGVAPRLLRVWADAGRQTLLRAIEPDADGSWPRERLGLPLFDATSLYLTAVDAVGNESEPVPLEQVEFVATAAPVSGRPSPHRAYLTASPGPALEIDPSTWSLVSGAGRLDGSAPGSSYSVQDPWRLLEPVPVANSVAPNPDAKLAGVYDRARGRLVVFGDDASIVWEWDGERWHAIRPQPPHPPLPTHPPKAAYDSVRGVSIFMGGVQSGAGRTTLWEWDGAAWTSHEPPSGLWGSGILTASIAFDARRGRLVLVGAAFRTSVYEWDGAEWLEIPKPVDGSTWPDSESYGGIVGALAYDWRRGVVVHLSSAETGASRLFEWDGQRWTQPAASGGPTQRIFGAAAAYDDRKGAVVFFGGYWSTTYSTTYLRDAWEWDGAGWTGRAFLSGSQWPAARQDAVAAYDVGRGALVVYGGRAGTALGDDRIWELRGRTFAGRDPTATSASPVGRARHLLVGDGSAKLLLAGGEQGSTLLDASEMVWVWDGVWRNISYSLFGRRSYAAAAVRTDAAGRAWAVLHGGWGSTSGGASQALGDTFEYDFARDLLSKKTTATAPGPRVGHAMAFDAARGVTVLFGGASAWNQIPSVRDTWEWNGTAWTNRTPATLPAEWPRATLGHLMWWDAARGRVQMAGGRDGYAYAQSDAWEWDGDTWLRRSGSAATRRWLGGLAVHPDTGDLVTNGGWSSTSVSVGTTYWIGPLGERLLYPLPATATVSRGDEVNLPLAWDPVRRGFVAFQSWGGTWALETPTERPQAAQFDAVLPESLAPAQITGIRVRAFAGASADDAQDWYQYTPVGVKLVAWRSGLEAAPGTGGAPGGWVELPGATNGAGLSGASTVPDTGGPALLDWSADGATARALLLERSRRVSLRLQPNVADARTRLGLDYLELRVRYRPGP